MCSVLLMDVAILVYFILFSLPFLIVFLPFILAWLKGAKKLRVAHEKYSKALQIMFRRLFNAETASRIINPLECVYEAQNSCRIRGKIWLVDRRAYFYYFAKLFKPINDIIFFSITTNFTPGLSLILVSREHGKLVEQAMAYMEQLEYVELRGLEDYFILTDNVGGLRHVLDEFTVRELVNMKKNFLYIIIDYTEPNVEFYVEVNEKNYASLLPRAVMLAKNIMERTKKISPRKERIDTIKMLKRALKVRE